MSMEFSWPFPTPNKVTVKWMTKSKAVLAACGCFAKICAEWMNSISVYNKETLHSAVEARPKDQPLLTVSNHKCCIDDPVLWGVLKWSHLVTNNDVMRWTLAASDIVFTKQWHSTFFSLGRVVPVVRGDGVYQKGMDFALDKLNEGEWVHTFPEGGINMTNENKRLKWGVGRLIVECTKLPLVIPLWHVGMDSIMPNTKPYIPRFGKKATLLVGQPIEFKALLQELRDLKKTPIAASLLQNPSPTCTGVSFSQILIYSCIKSRLWQLREIAQTFLMAMISPEPQLNSVSVSRPLHQPCCGSCLQSLHEYNLLRLFQREKRKVITDVIQEELRILRQKAELLHYSETLKSS